MPRSKSTGWQHRSSLVAQAGCWLSGHGAMLSGRTGRRHPLQGRPSKASSGYRSPTYRRYAIQFEAIACWAFANGKRIPCIPTLHALPNSIPIRNANVHPSPGHDGIIQTC